MRSLTSIMSTTGKRTVGWQHPALLPALLAPRGPGREAYVEVERDDLEADRLAGLPAAPRGRSDDRAGETFDRGVSASGVLRQMMAILTQPNRSHAAARAADAGAGRSTAWPTRWCTSRAAGPPPRRSPAPSCCSIDGMGHDLPPELFDTFADAIRRTADRAASTPPDARSRPSPRSTTGCAAQAVSVTGARQSESRSPVSVSNTCTLLRVGGDVDACRPCAPCRGALTRTMTLLGVPSTPLVP